MKIRYYGHVGQTSGYGRAAADLCMSLLATGNVDLEIRPLSYVDGLWNDDEARIALDGREVLISHCRRDPELTEPDMVIVHTLPMDCPKVHELVVNDEYSEYMAKKPWVAYTTWEASSDVPAPMADRLEVFDQVWVPSTVTAVTFTAMPPSGDPAKMMFGKEMAGGTPVRAIPHAFDPMTLLERRRQSHPTSDSPRFRFYWIGSWTSRKNPAGLLRAWAMAFGPDDPVELYLHSPGAQEPFAIAMHQTGLTSHELAPLKLSQQTRDEAWIRGLHATSDCFVTASRGEAFNLPAFDAMLAGRSIIAPLGHGSDDYLYRTTAKLLASHEAPAGVDVKVTERTDKGFKLSSIGAQGLTSRSTWREPDLCQLARFMREVAQAKSRDLTYLDGDAHIAKYTYESVGKTALQALEEL